MRAVPLLLVSAVVGVLGCGGYSSSTSGPNGGGHSTTIGMASSRFNPSPDTVSAGATVTWSNHDGYGHNITTVAGSAVSISENVAANASSSGHALNTPGTYNYYCSIHGTPTSGMRGTIVVQ